MATVDGLIQEGLKYIIKGRERDWKRFCKDNSGDISVVLKVIYALKALNEKNCNKSKLYDCLTELTEDEFIRNYIENMIVKYSEKGYEFISENAKLNDIRRRLINKINLSNMKYKNRCR